METVANLPKKPPCYGDSCQPAEEAEAVRLVTRGRCLDHDEIAGCVSFRQLNSVRSRGLGCFFLQNREPCRKDRILVPWSMGSDAPYRLSK